MNKEAISKFARDVRTSLSRHSPAILMGIGIAGMVTTTVVAVKATPKALRLIEEKKQELDVESLTPVETVKAAWKCYIPAAVTGAVSIACLIGSNSVNTKRNAALATAYFCWSLVHWGASFCSFPWAVLGRFWETSFSAAMNFFSRSAWSAKAS